MLFSTIGLIGLLAQPVQNPSSEGQVVRFCPHFAGEWIGECERSEDDSRSVEEVSIMQDGCSYLVFNLETVTVGQVISHHQGNTAIALGGFWVGNPASKLVSRYTYQSQNDHASTVANGMSEMFLDGETLVVSSSSINEILFFESGLKRETSYTTNCRYERKD